MAPFDATLTTKVSPLIEGQVPDFVQSDHPQFVQFIKDYYEFLEAAEIVISAHIFHVIQEKTDSQLILNEDGSKVVTETGSGTYGKFVIGETITGETSGATATVLVDDLENLRLFVSSSTRFLIGEKITGGSSSAWGNIVTYRDNPITSIQKLLDYADPDNTVHIMLDEMFNQFLQAIPKTLASGTSKRGLLKNIRDLYAAKGTSEGHKLFFRMMFAEEADIFYPTKYMMRVSDGKWQKKTIIRCENQAGANGNDIIGQYITGKTSGATCFVVDAIGFTQGVNSITEFEILEDSLVGTFSQGETVAADSLAEKVEMKFTIQKIVAGTTVDKPGMLYATGDTVSLDSTVGNGRAVLQVDQVGLGSVDEAVIDDAGSGYRVGDVLTFTTSQLSTVSAEGFVSVVGGSIVLEDSDNSDGYEDYCTIEENTKRRLIDFTICLEEDGGQLLIDGLDSSSTHAGYYFRTEIGTQQTVHDTYATPNDRIVLEEASNSAIGDITRTYITNHGSGYEALPTVTITSDFGTGGTVVPTTKDIGAILNTKNIDSGFNYQVAPDASIPVNFVLKGVSGSFSKDEVLTSHTGTITKWDADRQILSVNIEDVVRLQMEQDNDAISQQVEQELNTELVFSRVLGENVLETNDYVYWKDRGLADIDLDSRLTSFVTELGEERLVTNSDSTSLNQVSLEYDSSTYTMSRARVELEERRAEDGNVTVQDSETQHFEMSPYRRQEIAALKLDGHDVGDPIVMNASAADTDVGDNILLDGTDGSSTDAGSNIIQQTDGEGRWILFEDHPVVSNSQQLKDKFQLDGTELQVHTTGGWVNESRIASDGLVSSSSQVVTSYASEGIDIKLEQPESVFGIDCEIRLESATEAGSSNTGFIELEDATDGNGGVILGVEYSIGDFIAMDAFDDKWIFREGATLKNNWSGAGDRIKTEGEGGAHSTVPHDLGRVADETDGMLLEDSVADAVNNTKEFLILEGPDGNSSGTGEDGYYTLYEADTVAHANDSTDRFITEGGEPIIDEESIYSGFEGLGSGKIMMDNHLINGDKITIPIALDGTDNAENDSGDYIIFDGLSATERIGNTIALESGLLAGVADDVLGDDLLHEPENMVAGDILLDATNQSGLNAGDNLINEDGIEWVGKTITGANGATGQVVAALPAKVTVNNDFVATSIGVYKNTDSLISEDVIRIQDSYYYQDFSYEVKLGQSLGKYMNELKKAVHPAGFMPFGKVIISTSLSAAIAQAGVGVADAGEVTFSPILGSVLKEIFDLRIQRRIGLPHTYEHGAYFEELRLENGSVPDSQIAIDGTNFGTALEQEEGVVILQSLANDGDNILVTASDDGSQVDAGDQIILNGTDASGTNDGDVTGEYASLLLDGTSIFVSGSTETVNDEGSYVLMSGSALGEYELVDADSNSLVLNGTDDFPRGKKDRIVHEDGDDAGSNIVTDNVVRSTTLVETGGPIQVESAVSNIRGPYICTQLGERIVSEDFAETIVDGAILPINQKIGMENSVGDNLIFEDTSGVMMTEASTGTQGDGFDVNFIRLLKTKISVPPPRPLNAVGLKHMALDVFGSAVGVGGIQLEDGARKRGPTINSEVILLDSIDMGKKDDPQDYRHSGEPMELETATAVNLGVGTSFEDFYKWTRYGIKLDGTDGSGTNAGDDIALEIPSGGVIISEDVVISLPMIDFIRPDMLLMEYWEQRHSEYGRLVLNGSASDNSLGALDDGGQVLLDGTDPSSNNAGEAILFETDNEVNKSHDDRNNINILMETHGEGGGFILREYGGGAVSEGDMIVLDGTDSSSTDAADKFVQEDTEDDRVVQSPGAFELENDNASHVLLEDNGGCIVNEDTGAILAEIDEGAGHDISLEVGTGVGLGFKLLLEAQRIEIESGINDGEVPTASLGDASVFPSLTLPTEISTRPLGHVVLQDERAVTEMVLDGTDGSSTDAGDNIILNGTNALGTDEGDKWLHEDHGSVILDQHWQGHVLFNATDGSSTDAGDRIQWELGTYSSLLGTYDAFLPFGAHAETFDNTSRTKYDTIQQTFDVLEGS